jgi:hypothetical protein
MSAEMPIVAISSCDEMMVFDIIGSYGDSRRNAANLWRRRVPTMTVAAPPQETPYASGMHAPSTP